MADGSVVLVQRLGTYGLSVILAHATGYRSIYINLHGQRRWARPVTKGQALGTVGGSNTTDGPHLYFEIRGERGIALDPADWLKRRR